MASCECVDPRSSHIYSVVHVKYWNYCICAKHRSQHKWTYRPRNIKEYEWVGYVVDWTRRIYTMNSNIENSEWCAIGQTLRLFAFHSMLFTLFRFRLIDLKPISKPLFLNDWARQGVPRTSVADYLKLWKMDGYMDINDHSLETDRIGRGDVEYKEYVE